MTIRFGVVGTGWITDKFIDACRRVPGVAVTAVLSRELATAERFAARHSLPHSYDSIDAMCAGGEVDAVYIASPNTCHLSQSLVCFRYGLNVICEKPLAATAAQAAAMIAAAREHHCVLFEAMRITSSPVFRAVAGSIGKLGKVHKFVANFCQYSSKYERFVEGRNFCSLDWETAGGSLMDIGCYCVYPMIILFGFPKTVCAVGTLGRTGVDLEASVICGYENEMSAVLISSKMTNNVSGSEIQGENGTIVIDRMSTMNSAKLFYRDGTVEELYTSEEENDLVYEVREFYDMVTSGRMESDINTLQNSYDTMRVLDIARKQIGVRMDF